MTLLDRLTSDGPKRILSLQGGGLRGCITVGFLEVIEDLLRKRHGNENLVLRDYFDLIGGASTGSLITGTLVTGKSVAELKEIYVGMGPTVFEKTNWALWKSRYDDSPLSEVIDVAAGDVKISDPSITTGVCVVAKRADTASTWPIINHPHGKYYKHNKDILLRDAIRASGAAPTYFEPKVLDIGMGEVGAFVDGGVSPANNPALQLFLVATLRGFPFHWKTGEKDLLLVSMGTGFHERRAEIKDVESAKLWNWAVEVPDMLIEDGSWMAQQILQYLSRSPTPWQIDSEVGDLEDDLLGPEPLLSYLRYDVCLDEKTMKALDLPELVPRVESLRDMAESENVDDLYEIGRRAARQQVQEGHFDACFDLPPASGDS